MKKIMTSILMIILLTGLTAAPGVIKPEAGKKSNRVFDILFINGKIIDGTGNPWFYGDVGIIGDKVAAVGPLKGDATAKRTIDITGKIICPGFIDIHTHAYDRISSDKVWTGENEKRFFAPNYVSQGVTTLVSNQCGTSPLSIRQQKDILLDTGIGPNALLHIGHNSVRRHVMKGDFQRPATDEEVTKMRAFIRKAMKDGAIGLSSGLEYVPAIWSTTDEIVALMEEVVPYGGLFQAHERASGLTPMWYVPSQDAPGPPNMIENIEELIEVAERTGGKVIATHIKARGKNFWGASQAIIMLIEDARARGVDIWADCYPYNTSGSDGRIVLIPDWALGRGAENDLEAVLRDPVRKKALVDDIKHAINWRGGTENIIVMDHPNKNYIGKNIAQLARDKGKSDIEMIIALQLNGNPDIPGGARLRGFSMAEIDIEAFSAQPWTCTSSDGSIALPEDGPVHARFYGTFPRKIRHYAMERKVLSIEDAVRVSTSLPAQILSLRDRGLLREGFAADITVFDPETIRDTATFFEPHQFPSGIPFVLINGVFVVEEGVLTWKRPGRVLTPLIDPSPEK
ncbi:MAG: amidohydrolase family protein [Acidobacteria bacterium]|nr:amidohydrolase family protein [Acidobacteriota bacterium]MBU4331129.1 amidohydrolase family protein [Acidobacteriota bacterium]MBU4494321.1 amidohydrolase family protein [Acidobacteriota bacterium]MCG2814346.1 amidohydrolase family protein [Candidatus Aminicenantes bacterium]